MSYVLSEEAERDLLDIYDYSGEEWGPVIADLYLDGLYETFARAAELPKTGRLRPDLDLDLRSILYKSHVVFYVETAEGITVVRVLHQTRDIEDVFTA